jgi:hypothetical protein
MDLTFDKELPDLIKLTYIYTFCLQINNILNTVKSKYSTYQTDTVTVLAI